MTVFEREQIPYKEGMPNLVARDRVFLPKGYEAIVSTIDTARGPELARFLDALLGITRKFEPGVWIDRHHGKKIGAHMVIVASYPDRELALIGHEKIVDNVQRGRLGFKDISEGRALLDDPAIPTQELERYRAAPRRRPIRVRRHRRRRYNR